eukprot:g7367.t1
MYFIAVALSFALCASLFLLSIRTGALVEQSCSRISFFHHVVAAVLGAWAHWCYQDHLEEAAFGANDRFPVAVLLQHFNLGTSVEKWSNSAVGICPFIFLTRNRNFSGGRLVKIQI